ncbi:Nsp1p, related [Eimeria tenella]|uniref:Nsp1p, related n=1 Tax=Eimeria tenella TaxID=5802 RepID=U6KIV4_EIMTE|nr:Nsp1p, related [Eimeria tenella]CDJ37955.1 Nsp1p, related [Eimeria tenella]|eukprot:XP_013228793.1 Nsp1p, related [Eimeria tenella]
MHNLAKTASVGIETLTRSSGAPHLRLIKGTSPQYPKLQLGEEALKVQRGYPGFLFVRRRHHAGPRRCPTLVTLTLLAIVAAAYLVLRCRPHKEIQNGVGNATRSLAAADRAQGELAGICQGGGSGEFTNDGAQDAALDEEEVLERALLFTTSLKKFFEEFMVTLQKLSTAMRREGMSIILGLAVVELSAQATLLKVEQRHGIQVVLDTTDLLYDTLRRTFTKKDISLCGLRHLRQLRLFLDALPGIKWAGRQISSAGSLRKLVKLLELQEIALKQMLEGLKQLAILQAAFEGFVPDKLADVVLQEMRQTLIVRRFQLLRDPELNSFLREQHTERVRFGLCAFWQIQRALSRPLEQHHELVAELANTPLGLRLSEEQGESSGALPGKLESLSLENRGEPAIESADSAILLKASYDLGTEDDSLESNEVYDDSDDLGAEDNFPKANELSDETYGFQTEEESPKTDELSDCSDGFGAEADSLRADNFSYEALRFGAEACYPKVDQLAKEAYGFGAVEAYRKADNLSHRAYGFGAEAYYPKANNLSHMAYGFGAEASYPQAEIPSHEAYGSGAETNYPKAHGLRAETNNLKANNLSHEAYGFGAEAYYPKADTLSHEAYGFGAPDDYPEADELANDAYGFGLEENFLTAGQFGNEAHNERLYAGLGQAAVPPVAYNSLAASGIPLADDSAHRMPEEPEAQSDYVETAPVSLPQRPAFSVPAEAFKQFRATVSLQQTVSRRAALPQSASSLSSPYGLPRYARPFAAPGAAEFSDKSFVFGQSGSPERTWFVRAPAPGEPSMAWGAAQYTSRLPSYPPTQYPVIQLPLGPQYSFPRADSTMQYRFQPRQQQPFPGQHLMHMTGAGSHLPHVPSGRPPRPEAAAVTYGLFRAPVHPVRHPMQAARTPALAHEAHSPFETLGGAAESRQARTAAVGLWERAPGPREPKRTFHGVPLGEPVPKDRFN